MHMPSQLCSMLCMRTIFGEKALHLNVGPGHSCCVVCVWAARSHAPLHLRMACQIFGKPPLPEMRADCRMSRVASTLIAHAH